MKSLNDKGNGNVAYKLKFHQLENVKAEEDLGVIVDNKLNFSSHVQNKVKKANSILALVRQNFKFITPPVFMNLYKALIRPHLEYASVVWSPSLKRDKDLLERVQRRSTKII